jgi:hypothetical protein
MHFSTITAASFAALAHLVHAGPHGHSHLHARKHAHAVEARDDSTFDLTVHNNCSTTKSFGLFQISPSFEMIEMSEAVELEPGTSACIQAPFSEIGMRLSGTADKGCDGQWEAQTLFEFGYSAWSDLTGTAYDLSVMEGSEPEGIAAYPGTSECESKVCLASGCSLAQAWTDAAQEGDGSPADTVCYKGKQNFQVVWCPN